MCNIPFITNLKAWVTAKLEEHLYDSYMAFVYCHVKGRLPAFASGIKICSGIGQDLNYAWFISICCVVDSTVPVFVLKKVVKT